ncbi:hypothetical protein M9H77_30179 [Catharanthus roseus]|uniref:Uncharacterized protein n=1 Tax=Catharanthus roseus TaxID=4058 RepID=A0ACB9ZWJ6_CATRO|nr:hypothetical protein M9H77_30179 [Catharanthus roseus]
MSTQAQAPTPFGEESSNSQRDDPLRLIMQELQSLRDEMRVIRRDVTNLSNQQREMSTQAQAPTPFGEESSNSQHDDPLRVIMQELQSLRDEMRDIRRDVSNLSNQQREISPHGSFNATTPRSNGSFNCSRTTEFHQPPHFDEELHPSPYSGRRGSFGGRGMPRHFEEVLTPQARHGEPLYDDHEHSFWGLNFDVQDTMGQYPKVLNKLEIENSPWQMVGSPFAQAGKLPPIFGNVLTSTLE